MTLGTVGAAVMACVGAVVVAFAFVMFVMLGSATVNVAVSSRTEVMGSFWCSKSGEACSHLTWKCSSRIDHEVVIDSTRF